MEKQEPEIIAPAPQLVGIMIPIQFAIPTELGRRMKEDKGTRRAVLRQAFNTDFEKYDQMLLKALAERFDPPKIILPGAF
jgi:hypothetical protein